MSCTPPSLSAAAEATAIASLLRPDRPFRAAPRGLLAVPAADRALAAGLALPLAGGARAFAAVELIQRSDADESGMVAVPASLAAAREWAAAVGAEASLADQLRSLSAARGAWAGLEAERPLIMGIVNATPDSFSDGGEFAGDGAVEHGKRLMEAGADILDVGGESTRPGATPVDPEEERRRIEPVVRGLAEAGAVVSVDTRNASTMEAALAAGARIVNDVSALSGDPASLDVVRRSGAPVILMHMRGDPRTMQDDPVYACAALDVLEYLEARIAACVAAGIPRERIAVDPGIGFGKRLRHNRQLLAHLSLLHLTGCPILLGASRKSFISSSISRGETPKQRLPGSLVAAVLAFEQGVQMVRVHDVAETWQALQVWRGVAEGG